MSIYLVKQAMTSAIQADSAAEAIRIAGDCVAQMVQEPRPDVEALVLVHTLSQLQSGWTGDSLPYGGDGKTPLRDLLPRV